MDQSDLYELSSRLGRHSVLVSGHALPGEEQVDFDTAAVNLWHRIRTSDLAFHASSFAVQFSFSSGNIKLLCQNSEGSIQHQHITSFEAPEPSQYGQRKGNSRIFLSPRSRTLSIMDVYAYLFYIGTNLPSRIESLIIVSHAWEEGPIFLNSMDPIPTSPMHSPGDKDSRLKDLRPPQMGALERNALRSAFTCGGVCINTGCGGYKSLRPLLLRDHTNISWTAEEVHELKNSSMRCWNQAFANAAGITCFGAFPGFPTSLEMNNDKPTLAVPQQEIGDRPDFSPALLAIEKTLGMQRDPWGLGLLQFQNELNGQLQ